jgi:ketopantoate hydroxymethyltransferase
MKSTDDTKKIINEQYQKRSQRPDVPSVKVNLFKGYEVHALSLALSDVVRLFSHTPIDCIMAADSYINTHLGYTSTLLHSVAEQQLYIRVVLDIILELRLSMKEVFSENNMPYLIADMPYGSATHVDVALQNAENMIKYGADAIKLEVESDKTFGIIEELADNDFVVVAHIGYTPQFGGTKKRGITYQDAQELFKQARRVRDSGACVLVLEGVSSIVNQALSSYSDNALPVYSIFSGRALNGGQSINVWDAVYRPSFKSKYFPKTSSFDSSSFPETYSLSIIREHIASLLTDVWNGKFPDERSSGMSYEESNMVVSLNPWNS